MKAIIFDSFRAEERVFKALFSCTISCTFIPGSEEKAPNYSLSGPRIRLICRHPTQKRRSVSAMLQKTAEISWDLELLGS
jgi:hypothetical protein